MKILLVEDDESLANLVRDALIAQHYLVDLATDGQVGWELAESFTYDLILLDLMLPKLDGINFCKQRRQEGDRTPILLVTAQNTSTTKVTGLDAGADDYVVKPFDLQELLARIRALLRRTQDAQTPTIEWGAFSLDPRSCLVTYDDRPLKLTAKEYGLLELFLRNPQRIFSKSALLDRLWSFEEPPSETAVRTQMKGLRQKLKQAGARTDEIETIYGLGYRLKAKEEKSAENRQPAAPKPETTNPSTSELNPSPTNPPPPERTKLNSIWQQHKPKYLERIAVIQKAIDTLQTHTLSPTLHENALREAHTLAGGLGIFGFKEASNLSREIEQIWLEFSNPNTEQIQRLAELTIALQQELEDDLRDDFEPQPSNPASETVFNWGSSIVKGSRLLVVEDDVALAQAVAAEASAWGMQVEIAENLDRARRSICDLKPDVVLLDLCFPDSTESGFALLDELQNTQHIVPVVVFTTREGFAERVKVARLGGRGFLAKPIAPSRVLDAIAQVLDRSYLPVAKLLVVDDDPETLDGLRTILEPWGFNLTLLDGSQEFWETLKDVQPDLLLLDLDLPEFSGIELCQVVRNDPRWHELPILMLCTRTDPDTVQRVFSVGADDCVSKPIIASELVARVLNRIERSQLRRQWATATHRQLQIDSFPPSTSA
ncbi:response regulator [Oscillatoriales cyanobacterium LEGE 11467]|uniref:Response regulator n=1 Tax=Zarconia navalis LEGE 11467 TaxID=1828826 RepID=A0A928VXW8_9CYAN|nr:response regulator [Zarconia navalis]MBE9041639.1 response regulator [Zarconia navalis LEGE 11467]